MLILGARSRQRTESFTGNDEAEAERVRYMEQILTHFMPHLTFDLSTLRNVAVDLRGSRGGPSESHETSTQMETDDLGDLAIDEEDFSIRAYPDNTTRASIHGNDKRNAYYKVATSTDRSSRILGGILLSKFFNEDPEENRRMDAIQCSGSTYFGEIIV